MPTEFQDFVALIDAQVFGGRMPDAIPEITVALMTLVPAIRDADEAVCEKFVERFTSAAVEYLERKKLEELQWGGDARWLC